MESPSEADLQWLRELNPQIWNESYSMYAGLPRTMLQVTRKLSVKEWARIRHLVKSCELPITMVVTRFGFSVGVHIHDHAPYPGCRPEPLVMITAEQLPGFYQARDGNGFELGWSIFSTLTHVPRNVEVLSYYGLEEPKAKSHYAY